MFPLPQPGGTQVAPLPRRDFGCRTCSRASNHLESVSYTDGDGGLLITDHIPGLLEVSNGLGVSQYLIKVGDRVHTGIQFREKHHDAVELGHKNK